MKLIPTAMMLFESKGLLVGLALLASWLYVPIRVGASHRGLVFKVANDISDIIHPPMAAYVRGLIVDLIAIENSQYSDAEILTNTKWTRKMAQFRYVFKLLPFRELLPDLNNLMSEFLDAKPETRLKMWEKYDDIEESTFNSLAICTNLERSLNTDQLVENSDYDKCLTDLYSLTSFERHALPAQYYDYIENKNRAEIMQLILARHAAEDAKLEAEMKEESRSEVGSNSSELESDQDMMDDEIESPVESKQNTAANLNPNHETDNQADSGQETYESDADSASSGSTETSYSHSEA